MKKNILLILAFSLFLASCSSDKGEAAENPADAIIGTWDATEFRIDDNTASDDAILGREILEFLANKNCVIISLQFNADLTATATNSSNYVGDFQTTETGFDILCPTESDIESSTYTYDGSVVVFLTPDGETETVNVTIDGETMIVNAADLDIPDFDESGELIFTKR
ncbi:hypothetical protein [Maribacter sp. 2210JD10-5]|uniref:hypothetical protein n=1 Tax=Maribacter sp. 2210JD10-5 TaxID=3386272 RepID=UPI0039BCA08A